MKMPFGLLALACLSLSLSSCADNRAEWVPSSSGYQWSLPIGDLPLSSPSVESRRGTSTAVAPSSESSAAPEPSSSSVVYCTVSIYQSYYIENEGRYGNPRFDTSVVYEAGTLLYSNFDERSDLMEKCRDDYRPIGGDGAYGFHAFFYDKECTRYIGYDCYINSDFRIYYYCDG